MDTKELIKLAQACRKAGIKRYKDEHVEFELSDYVPTVVTKTRKSVTKNATSGFTSTTNSIDLTDGWDALSDEQKLFYSSTPHETDESQ